MPNIRAAAKSMRQSAKRRVHNRMQRAEMRTLTKKTQHAIEGGQLDLALGQLPATLRAIGKSAQKGQIHKNKAARLASRLTRQVSALKNKAQSEG